MKRRRSVAIEALGMLAFAVVALGFQATVRYRPQAHGAAWSAQQLSSSSFERTLARPAQTQRMPNGHRNGVVSRGVTMMARARYLLAEQKRRAKSAAPVILSAKDKRKANRERRAHYREKFARSGSRLVKLQQEDPDSFYIGFLGTNGAGRAAALKSVETFLKRVTELKVLEEETMWHLVRWGSSRCGGGIHPCAADHVASGRTNWPFPRTRKQYQNILFISRGGVCHPPLALENSNAKFARR